MLYETLAQKIETQIKQGVLKPGDRIPSVRKMSTANGVSVSTVLQAYMTLEGKGFIEARPQSGYYVKALGLAAAPEPQIISGIQPSVQVDIVREVRRVIDADSMPGVTPFAAAIADPALYPTAALARTIHQVSRKLGPSMNGYSFAPGYRELRRQIARKAMDHGCTLDPDKIVITIGGMEALNIAARLVAKPGDVVAVESPTYYGILQVLQNLGIKAVEIPIRPREGICLDDLQEALKKHPVKALITMPNFHNPMGALMDEDRKCELMKIAQKHDLPVIEDTVYSDLHFDDEIPSYLKRYDKKGQVIICSSFSKALSPGLRIGWIHSEKHLDQILNLKFMSSIASPTLNEAAVAEFLKSGQFDRHVRGMRKKLETQLIHYQNCIAQHFPEGTCFTRPRGGFVLWVELPPHVDTDRLHGIALKEGISFAPGSMFTTSTKFSNCLRLNCGHPMTPKIEKSLIKLGALARNYRR